MIPYEIQLALEVPNVRGNGDDSVLVGDDKDVLTSGTISTEAARTAAPHLIAIALHPIARLLGHTPLGSLFHAGARIDALHLFL